MGTAVPVSRSRAFFYLGRTNVAAYVEALGTRIAKPTVKQHLAVRMCFDWLVTGGILTVNPAHAVRGPKHVIKRGKAAAFLEVQAGPGPFGGAPTP
jgi:site-specific recombinase XerC